MIRAHVDALPESALDLALVFARLAEPDFMPPKVKVEYVHRLALRLTGIEGPLDADALVDLLRGIPEPVGIEAMALLTRCHRPDFPNGFAEVVRFAIAAGRLPDVLAVVNWLEAGPPRKITKLPRVEGLTDEQRHEALVEIVSDAIVRLPASARGYAWSLLVKSRAHAMLPAARDMACAGLQVLPRPPVDPKVEEQLLDVVDEQDVDVTDPTAQVALLWFVLLVRAVQPYGKPSVTREMVSIGWLGARTKYMDS